MNRTALNLLVDLISFFSFWPRRLRAWFSDRFSPAQVTGFMVVGRSLQNSCFWVYPAKIG
jgi:hypothetical protein